MVRSLNPYYTGRWFLLTQLATLRTISFLVLILIILEDGFCYLESANLVDANLVLILIILEDGFCLVRENANGYPYVTS